MSDSDSPNPRNVRKAIHAREVRRRQDRFIKGFSALGTITHAAQAAGINPKRHYEWLADPRYAKRFEDAKQKLADKFEQILNERVEKGIERPVYQGGKLVGHETVHSDKLMELRLRSLDPARFGSAPQVNVAVVQANPYNELPEDERRAMLDEIQRRKELVSGEVIEVEKVEKSGQ